MIDTMNRCPECQSTRLNIHNAELHCKECGLVIEDNIPSQQSYREGTSITPPSFVSGKIIKQQWTLNSTQKNLYKAKNTLKIISSKLHLPRHTEEQTINLYTEAVNKNLCVGRNKESILYACVYATCNQNEIPKTITEITEYTDMKSKQVLRSYNLIKKELNLKIKTYDAEALLPRFTTELKLSHETLTKAIKLIQKIKGTTTYEGKNPKSIAAATIYIASKQNKENTSQRDIANKTGVMETTIRKRYKEIEGTFKNYKKPL